MRVRGICRMGDDEWKPDTTFLLGLGKVRVRTTQASERKCWQCAYRAGHGKVLTAKEEAKFKKGSARLFLRKVQGPGE